MKRKFNFELLVILILLLAMNIPLLSGTTQIFWDTFNTPYHENS
jgi:hypothetical protein